MSETFLEKYGNDIHQWLAENQFPPTTYAAASIVDTLQRNGGVQRYGNFLRLAGNLYRQLFSNIF